VHVDGDGAVVAIGAPPEGGTVRMSCGYTGMAVLSPDALRYFPREAPGDLVSALRAMIDKEPGSVLAYAPPPDCEGIRWGEIGSCEGYLRIHSDILVGKAVFDPALAPPPLPLHADEASTVDPAAEWRGFLSVCAGATIETDVTLEDCVVLDDTVVPAGTRLRRSVLFPGGILAADGVPRERHE
jgi:NDP-sugar pyrophosphorylase family protein